MNDDDRLERLLDDKAMVSKVDNRDLRWMLLLLRKDFQAGLKALAKAVSAQEDITKALAERVHANAIMIGNVQQAHNSCPLSSEESRDNFVNGAVKDAVTDAVQEANGTKPIIGPLNRMELFQVLGWVIMVLVVSLVFLATNGGVTIPLP